MMRNKVLFAIAVTFYTAAVVAAFIFLPVPGGSANNECARSYKYVVLTDAEKKEVFDSLGVNIEKLADSGFPTYSESFLSPSDWTKELHAVRLAFENVYCYVEILCHADEVGWARADNGPVYGTVEIAGRQLRRAASGRLEFDDKEKNIVYYFDCSESSDSEVYRHFLGLFFGAEDI